MDTKNKIIISLIGVVLAFMLGGALYYFFFSKNATPSAVKGTRVTPKIISENLQIPNTVSVGATEGRMVNAGTVAVPLVPKDDSERVIVPQAVLTVQGTYLLAQPEAVKWSADAKLVFIKSLGAITLEGKSSQWQAVFSAKTKPKKGYEVIIQRDKVVSQKEIDSTATGADVPKNFSERDGQWAIAQMALIPQFQNASVSTINFSYNPDAKAWDYIIANSYGNSAIRVR